MNSSDVDHVYFTHGQWECICIPADGGRLSSLRYRGIELFTRAPVEFNRPKQDYGRYELRPVYGYDDCFPSVVPCAYPESDWKIADHGELCWLSSQCSASGSLLRTIYFLQRMPAVFVREMIFAQANLEWHFSVLNYGEKALPFQHVMHPLMQPDHIKTIVFPEYESIHDERDRQESSISTSSLWQTLRSMPQGSVAMLLLSGINSGAVTIDFESGIRLRIVFDRQMFQTLGIWWNYCAYPDEDGCRRRECAFEPIPGITGSLADDYENGSCPVVHPREAVSWKVMWNMEDL